MGSRGNMTRDLSLSRSRVQLFEVGLTVFGLFTGEKGKAEATGFEPTPATVSSHSISTSANL